MLSNHCMSRLPPNVTMIPADNITKEADRIFTVKSVDSTNTYTVDFGVIMPSCSCEDWGRHHIPCKHMLSIFQHVDEFDWEALPATYKSCPHFSLDPEVLVQASNMDILPEVIIPSNQEVSLDDDLIQALNIDILPEIVTPLNQEVLLDEDLIQASNIEPTTNQNALPLDCPSTAEIICSSKSLSTATDGQKIQSQCLRLVKNIQKKLFNVPYTCQQELKGIEETLSQLDKTIELLIPEENGLPVRNLKIPKKKMSKQTKLSGKGLRKIKRKNRQRKHVSFSKSNNIRFLDKSEECIIIDGTFDMDTESTTSSGNLPEICNFVQGNFNITI